MKEWTEKDRKGIYDIKYVLDDFIAGERGTFKKQLGDVVVRVRSPKLNTFKKSIKCARCGLKAEYFALEREYNTPHKQYHFNLYGKRNDTEIIFNVDHIVPKSKGGKNMLSNFQTMCYYCNFEKGNGES